MAKKYYVQVQQSFSNKALAMQSVGVLSAFTPL